MLGSIHVASEDACLRPRTSRYGDGTLTQRDEDGYAEAQEGGDLAHISTSYKYAMNHEKRRTIPALA